MQWGVKQPPLSHFQTPVEEVRHAIATIFYCTRLFLNQWRGDNTPNFQKLNIFIKHLGDLVTANAIAINYHITEVMQQNKLKDNIPIT